MTSVYNDLRNTPPYSTMQDFEIANDGKTAMLYFYSNYIHVIVICLSGTKNPEFAGEWPRETFAVKQEERSTTIKGLPVLTNKTHPSKLFKASPVWYISVELHNVKQDKALDWS